MRRHLMVGSHLWFIFSLGTNLAGRKNIVFDWGWGVFFECDQGDQIEQFNNIWLLFTWVFLKFYLNKQFQNTVCCTYFNIQKPFDATIFDFQFELL